MKAGSIIATLIGGAIVGSAVTMCMCKDTKMPMGRSMHRAILDKLNFIQGHIDECCCMMGGCDCNSDKVSKMEMNRDGESTAEKM